MLPSRDRDAFPSRRLREGRYYRSHYSAAKRLMLTDVPRCCEEFTTPNLIDVGRTATLGFSGVLTDISMPVSPNLSRLWYGAGHDALAHTTSLRASFTDLVQTCCNLAYSATSQSVLCRSWYEHESIVVLTTMVFAALSAKSLWTFDTVNLLYVLAALGTSFATTLCTLQYRNFTICIYLAVVDTSFGHDHSVGLYFGRNA